MKIPKREDLPKFSPNKYQAVFITFMIYVVIALALPEDIGVWMLVLILGALLLGACLYVLYGIYSLLGEL